VAAKHGIVGFTKVTALETAQTGVTANAICPGWVLTPLVQKQAGRARRRKAFRSSRPSATGAREAAFGQFVTPEELGALAVVERSRASGARRDLEHGRRLGQ
jgi:3-hydroxybutyrate dehydrogenase